MRLPISGELSLVRVGKGVAILAVLGYLYSLVLQGGLSRQHRHSHLLESNAITASVVYVQKRPPLFVDRKTEENYAHLFEVAVEVRNNTAAPLDAAELPSMRAQMSDGPNLFGDFYVHSRDEAGSIRLTRPAPRKYLIPPGKSVLLLYVLFAPIGTPATAHPVVVSLVSDDEQKPLPPRER